jgi:hypothetical protein
MKQLLSIGVFLTLAMSAGGLSAQGPPGQLKGNPTAAAGVEQPPAPVLADRITLIGCVTRVGAAAADPNSYSDSRFVLTNPQKQDRVPAGAGTSAAAKAPVVPRYRLAAVDTSLAPFVGTKVELSGEIVKPAEGTGTTLRVEFVQKLAATCP